MVERDPEAQVPPLSYEASQRAKANWRKLSIYVNFLSYVHDSASKAREQSIKKVLDRLKLVQYMKFHNTFVKHLQISPDGSHLVVAR